MASVAQLEKLHQIERIFYVETSLEAAVAGERVRQLIELTERTISRRANLRDDRRRLRQISEILEERKNALKLMERKDWVDPSVTETVNVDSTVRLNIGGLMFQVKKSVLMRDPTSTLAKLCGSDAIVLAARDSDGTFVFDRDWWIFRYILRFLRDGSLPEDRALLAQIYREAAYWVRDYTSFLIFGFVNILIILFVPFFILGSC